jgi:hypothetical protein
LKELLIEIGCELATYITPNINTNLTLILTKNV